jgi:hypothetical protein
MKLKGKAVGEQSVPSESRRYFSIHFLAEGPTESTAGKKEQEIGVFFHKDWVIGVIVDRLAKLCKLVNVNNGTDEAQWLRLFHGADKMMDMGRSIESYIADGSIEQGQLLYLKRG